jgi:hypothetical protein
MCTEFKTEKPDEYRQPGRPGLDGKIILKLTI